MAKIKLEAPWYTFRKKVYSLFENDPEITVGAVYEAGIGEDCEYAFDIEVQNNEKFVALDRVFPKVKEFGTVRLGIYLFDEENNSAEDDAVSLFETIFEGNPILRDVKTAEDHTGTRHGYVRFQPEVIQFFDDDISDYSGNWSGLAQDIAREVFAEGARGVHFCTAPRVGEPKTEEEEE